MECRKISIQITVRKAKSIVVLDTSFSYSTVRHSLAETIFSPSTNEYTSIRKYDSSRSNEEVVRVIFGSQTPHVIYFPRLRIKLVLNI